MKGLCAHALWKERQKRRKQVSVSGLEKKKAAEARKRTEAYARERQESQSDFDEQCCLEWMVQQDESDLSQSEEGIKIKVKQRLAERNAYQSKLQARIKAKQKSDDENRCDNIWEKQPESARSRRMQQLQERRDELTASAAAISKRLGNVDEQERSGNTLSALPLKAALRNARQDPVRAEQRKHQLERQRQKAAATLAAEVEAKALGDAWSAALTMADQETLFMSIESTTENEGRGRSFARDGDGSIFCPDGVDASSWDDRLLEKTAKDEQDWARAKEEEAEKRAEKEDRGHRARTTTAARAAPGGK
jgi:hypothetical protein